jgi:hypothetical protein
MSGRPYSGGIRRPRLRLKPFDWAALVLGAALTVAAAVRAYTGEGADRIVIQGAGGRWIYPPDAHERILVSGPLGDTVVEIRDGAARILSSPCSNQTCVAAGSIARRGQWVACLPNGALVRVEGAAPSEAASRKTASQEADVDAAVW